MFLLLLFNGSQVVHVHIQIITIFNNTSFSQIATCQLFVPCPFQGCQMKGISPLCTHEFKTAGEEEASFGVWTCQCFSVFVVHFFPSLKSLRASVSAQPMWKKLNIPPRLDLLSAKEQQMMKPTITALQYFTMSAWSRFTIALQPVDTTYLPLQWYFISFRFTNLSQTFFIGIFKPMRGWYAFCVFGQVGPCGFSLLQNRVCDFYHTRLKHTLFKDCGVHWILWPHYIKISKNIISADCIRLNNNKIK